MLAQFLRNSRRCSSARGPFIAPSRLVSISSKSNTATRVCAPSAGIQTDSSIATITINRNPLWFFRAGVNLLWPDYGGSTMIETKNADLACS